MKRNMISRVTETEFETEDGKIIPHPFPFEKDQVPSIEEFQRFYDDWLHIFQTQGIIESEGKQNEK